jgi:hypothetical protein
MINLDIKCAEWAEIISAKADDTAITTALSVLEEQGLYAFFLFLESKKYHDLSRECKTFLQNTPDKSDPFLKNSREDDFKNLRDLTEKLDRLLWARDLLIQTLIYARYHAKAKKKMGGDK